MGAVVPVGRVLVAVVLVAEAGVDVLEVVVRGVPPGTVVCTFI